jgi:type IV pilus assembly protein PilV
MSKLSRSTSSSAGFTLIEVLVVILIMSIGMLGIAGLQASTSRFKINSWARASTAVLYSDFADRVRSNPLAAGVPYSTSGSATAVSAYTLADNWSTQQSTTLSVAKDCMVAANACTQDERAAYDVMIWRQQLRSMLPQGAGFISGNMAAGLTLTMMWYDKQFVKPDNSADQTINCSLAGTSAAARTSCCPDAAAAPVGVRCLNFMFVP